MGGGSGSAPYHAPVSDRALDPAEIDEPHVVRPAAHVGTVPVDRELVVVDEATGRVHALNPTAALVWECLDGQASLATIVDELQEAFGAPRATISADVLGVVREFGTLGFLRDVRSAPDAPPIEIRAASEGETTSRGELPADEPSFDHRYLAAPPNG